MSKQTRKQRTLESLIRKIARQEIEAAHKRPWRYVITQSELLAGLDDFFKPLEDKYIQTNQPA